MKNSRQLLRCLLTAAACSGFAAHAAVSADEAKQLGGPLTEFGAERAGNADGSIPAYTGTGAKTPKGWKPTVDGTFPQRPDPYGEKPLFSITAANAAQYADKLDGTIEMFKRYPNFRMDIYPSHRDFRMPPHVLANTVKNATECKAVDNELKLEGCYGGLPFPIPKTGNQAMWNHLGGYQSWSVQGRAEVWLVPPEGSAVLVDRPAYTNNWPGFDPAMAGRPLAPDAKYYRYIGTDEAPPRIAGGRFMFLDPVDWVGEGRRAYLYVTGRRWVKLAADLSYDTPTPYGGGIATMDDQQGFMGALDRYDFELVGKKEKFIYYDNYAFSDRNACPIEKVSATKGFLNPDCVRWELHRVWVVKAKLKPGFNHIYHTRIFYWDEDSFEAGATESFDENGKLIRYVNNLSHPYFEAPGIHVANTFTDLPTGIWVVSGLQTCATCGETVITKPLPGDTYNPDAMAGAGVR